MNTKNISSKKFFKDYGELTFAKLLSSWRISLEISQKEFSQKLGITPSSLCDLEKGRKIPGTSRAVKIAKKLGLPPALLVQVAFQDALNQSKLNFKVSVAA